MGTSGLSVYFSSCSLIDSTTRFFSLTSMFRLLMPLWIPICSFHKTKVKIQLQQCQHSRLSFFLFNRHLPTWGIVSLWPKIREILSSPVFALSIWISFSYLKAINPRYLWAWILEPSSIRNFSLCEALYSLILFSFFVIPANSYSVKSFLRSSRSLLISMATLLSCLTILSLYRQKFLTFFVMPILESKCKHSKLFEWRTAVVKSTNTWDVRPVLSKLMLYMLGL